VDREKREYMKKKCPMCQAVDELAPSKSYCPDHDYPNRRKENSMDTKIGCAVSLLSLQIFLIIAPIVFIGWVIVVLLKHFGVI